MTTKSNKQKPALTSMEARRTIEKDIAAFLAAGNKIQQIPSGVSGQDATASRKHLVLGQGQKAKRN
jgi:hypothetical protein